MSKSCCCVAVIACVVAAPLAGSRRVGDEKKGYMGMHIRQESEDDKIVVLALDDDGPAKKAGILPGDSLVMIGDLKPTSLATTVKFIQSLKPGTKIKVRVERGDQEKDYEVTIGER
jgi:C-terminal processing protease CtpA/Prc